MTPRRMPVDAAWELKGYGSLDWAMDAATHGWEGPGWIPARVPGSVAHDVWQAGGGPSPYVECGSLAYEWVAARAWRYRTSLEVPPLAGDERARLRFDGVDHDAVVLLDGTEVARHTGMFTPFEVALEGVRPGGHRLEVVVGPAPPGESQVGRTSRVRTHRSRMSEGWDFCPRLVHQGVWRAVTLEVTGATRIGDVWVRPRWADGPGGDGIVDCRLTLAADATEAIDATASVTLQDGDRVLAAAEVPVAGSVVDVPLRVPAPRPWRPNGLGEPVVHRLTVRITAAGAAVDERGVPVGFRDARLVPNEGGPADARPYTLDIDGRRTYVNGWNWAPLDVFHGVQRPGHLAHLVRLARDAGVNVLRVWGGGLIEDEAFYEACDAAGILVWQEFALSSSQVDSVPADDPAYVELLRTEAEALVPLRRNHPSLLLWCGGNELHDEGRPLDGSTSPVLAAIGQVVAELDPDRGFLPTSPSGPRFHNRLEDIRAAPDDLWDVHGPWEHQGLAEHNGLYDAGTSLLSSEFGVEGMANRRQHEALIGPERRWPAGRENDVYRHLGEWWDNEPLVQASFAGRIGDLDTLRRASQHLQADGLRYAVEANRRRWPRNSGSLPWQLAESFPNAWCTAAVDHRGDPKPAFFGVRRAYAPVHVCARFARWAWDGAGPFRATIHAWSRDPIRGRVTARASIRLVDGRTLAETSATLDGLADRPADLGTIEAALPAELAVLDLALEDADRASLARNGYVVAGTADLAPLLALAPARVDVRRHGDADTWTLELRHTGGPAALGLVIDDDRPITEPGWAEAADGWFDLLPGEVRSVAVRWADAPEAGRRLRIHGWNVDVLVD